VSRQKNVVKLTKTFVDKSTPDDKKDQTFYRDELLKGFALRITSSGTKSFVIEKAIGNKVKRITIGKYSPILTVEIARKKAQILLGKIADGKDPIAEKQSVRMHQTTLMNVLEDYMQARKSLSPKTLYDYKKVVTNCFPDWLNKPLVSISKDNVEKRHMKVGKERGETYANFSMRVLRALFNFAAGKYEDSEGRSLISDNPVKRLSQTRAWYRVERRKTYIKSHEMNAWYQGLSQINNEIFRDYLLLILFTGLRRQEAASLRWDQVDLKGKTLTINNTKNHEQHILPLSDYLYDLLSKRKLETFGSDFVFPGSGTNGYIHEPRKQTAKVMSHSGVNFTIHDLRRTFITIAEGLDIPAYALKRLLNHKMHNDVTAGYIMTDVERLRRPMQQITDFILKCMGVLPSEVINLNTKINFNSVYK